jgi:hypothetical protein
MAGSSQNGLRFVLDFMFDIAAPRLNKTTRAFNGARTVPPKRRRASTRYSKIKIGDINWLQVLKD